MILLTVAPYALPVLLHALGLIVLLKTPSQELGLTNKLYFINLSIAELVLSVTGILHRVLSKEIFSIIKMVQYLFGSCVMYLVMIFLTLDRFFRVYLNIKFQLYWSDFRTTVLLVTLWSFECVLFASAFLIGVKHALYMASFIFPIFDFIFLVTAVSTYSYIFTKILANSREQNKARISAQTESSNTSTTSTNTTNKNRTRGKLMIGKQFLSIFLLVLTFVLFTIVADGIHGYHFVFKKSTKVCPTIETMTIVMYSLSYTADVIIYVFGSKYVRKALRQIFSPVSRHTSRRKRSSTVHRSSVSTRVS